MKKQWKKMAGLVVLCAAASMSAQAAVTIDMGNGAGSVPGVSGNFTDSDFSNMMTNTTEGSTYTLGTFASLPSGNPGSGVSFDVVAVSSANVAAQPGGLGVQGGASNVTIDNNNAGGPLEWASLALTNVTGLGAGDLLVITSAEMLYLAADESYRLDIGSAGSAPVSADVLGGGTLIINSDAFTLGAGSQGNTKFVLGSITVDVLGEPGTPIFIDEHFTAAEGYADGPLNGPWSGDLDSFTVDSSGTGTVLLSETNIFEKVTHSTLLATNGLYTIGMEFSFNRSTNDITDNNNTLFEMLLYDGTDDIGFGLSRVNGVGSGNRYKLKSNSTSDLSPRRFANSDTFTEDLLGFTNAADNVSDQLWMGATVVRGMTTNDWTATFVISNLTQNAEVFAWDRPDFFYLSDEALFSAVMALDEADETLVVSNRVVDRFFASSTGDGVVVLDPYSVWASDNGVGGMEEDFDEDGLNNLGEYALKGDPKDPNDQGLTEINTPGGTFEYVHAMLSNPQSGVEYIVEVNDSGDLVFGGWTNAGITVTSGALDADYDMVTNAIPTTGSQNFIRLQINEQ